jgi:ribosomal-protein-alanine N-acetyltransferase
MSPTDLARLHAASFTTPRAWSEAEFAGLLASEGSFLIGAPGGFALARAVAGEAEVLTLAVAPEARRQGIGSRLLAGVLGEAARRGCRTVFLEVAADNGAACALYRRSGFAETGRRPGYYATPDGRRIDAMVLARPLPLLPPV